MTQGGGARRTRPPVSPATAKPTGGLRERQANRAQPEPGLPAQAPTTPGPPSVSMAQGNRTSCTMTMPHPPTAPTRADTGDPPSHEEGVRVSPRLGPNVGFQFRQRKGLKPLPPTSNPGPILPCWKPAIPRSTDRGIRVSSRPDFCTRSAQAGASRGCARRPGTHPGAQTQDEAFVKRSLSPLTASSRPRLR